MSGDNGAPGLRPGGLGEDPTAAPEPDGSAGVGRRLSRMGTSVWSAVRPTRTRATGYLALSAVGALIGTSVAVGAGAAGAVPDLSDIGAWLGSSDNGTAAHANGLTGAVDGKVNLPTGKHPVSIAQNGKTVLVLDKSTGKVIRIDPSQLTADQATNYSSSDLQLVSGGSFAYVVDPQKGTVQRIDPERTTPIGTPVSLGTDGLGKAVVDPQGTLWVPEPLKGKVVPFPGGKKGKALTVGKPNHDLEMTLANGKPVVTDTAAAVMTALNVGGVGTRINLPDYIDDTSPEHVLVPDATDGNVVPVLSTETGKMVLVDTGTADQTTATVGKGTQYGAPQVLGTRVYVPDESRGQLKVYDTANAAFDPPITVTGKKGHLETFVRNGLLWVNDQHDSAAAVINSDGKSHPVGKYKDNVPTAKKPKHDTPPARDNVPDQPAVPPVSPPDSGSGQNNNPNPPARHTHKPKAPADPCKSDPSKCAAVQPTAPGTPQAQSGADGVTVNFSPASGSLKPTGYSLNGAGSGKVNPGTVSADGPFTFQVSGLNCSTSYSFTVVAHYKGGKTKESGASPAVRPCTAPAQPRSPRATPAQGGHGGTVSWAKPANASGGMSYAVSWPGGSTTTSSTSAKISGLANSKQYNVSITAKNEAGSAAPLTVQLNLAPPQKAMNVADNVNNGEDVGVRTAPTTASGSRVTSIPSGYSGGITVYCQTKGSMEEHDTYHYKSDIWDKVTYKGKTGWMSDLWVSTANHRKGQFSPQDVWQCS